LYRTHRYIYVSERQAEEDKETVGKGLEEISEWYSRVLGVILKAECPPDSGLAAAYIKIFNAFVSKNEKE
jgi:hypothetical protein